MSCVLCCLAGRRDNQWTSPFGCLQFSAHLPIPNGFLLQKHLVFLQYICSLAVVQGVCGMAGYEVRLIGDFWYQVYFANCLKHDDDSFMYKLCCEFEQCLQAHVFTESIVFV